MSEQYTTVAIKFVPRIYQINTEIQNGDLSTIQFSANWTVDIVTSDGQIIGNRGGGLTTLAASPEILAAIDPILSDIRAQVMNDFLLL
jgi:hypothetical protein